MVNPMKMVQQFKEMGERFKQNHPKVEPFCQAALGSLREGSIIEIKVTDPDGREMCSNIRVNAEDMQLLREVSEFAGSNQ
jgi:hypothetical protein